MEHTSIHPSIARQVSCVHTMFEARAAATPQAVAIRQGDRCMTYEELNARANQLAWHLHSLGVATEVPVGLSIAHSFDTVIAGIAVLKAGGAYVSLSRHDPVAFRNAIARAAGIRHVIVDESSAGDLGEAVHAVRVDATLSRYPSCNPHVPVGLENAAFVRFTSGSGGAPKAVINTHRGLASRLASLPLPDIREGDVCALRAGFGSRLFYPLVLGAPLVIFRDDEARDAVRLARALGRHGVTSLYVVPTLLRELLGVDASLIAGLGRLRAVTVGGESLVPDLIDRFHRALPRALLINIYGSAEIGTAASLREVTPGARESWRSIGRPVVNTRIHVLDDELKPVRPGEVGELYVSSPHLARGYLGDPELTAARFLPDRFDSAPAGRMYKTGDLGRLSEDGSIEFMGRADTQIKVRGFRVELEEVESALLAHDAVESAAIVNVGTDGDTDLVACVTIRDGHAFPGSVREYLSDRLPSYMVPGRFVRLDHLPMTHTGKIDRRVLASAMGGSKRDASLENSRAATRIEAVLIRIWRDVFKRDDIGLHDDFLQIGGTSLTAMRITARVFELLHVELPPTAVFESPTLTQFAAVVGEALRSEPPFN